jgi:hypothetical protein
MGVPAEGGVRPGVYAGFVDAAIVCYIVHPGLSRPFTGVLFVGTTGGP